MASGGPERGQRPPLTGLLEAASSHAHMRPDAPKMSDRNKRIGDANRAFSNVKIRPNRTLKNSRKLPFIQELMDLDFALGAPLFSWHN
jgi:hypothetical protein